MSDFSFGDATSIPTVTRNATREPNPFEGKFPSDDAAIPVTFPADADTKAVEKVIRQAYQAARDADRTARIKRQTVTVGTGKNARQAVQLIVWTVAKRPPQNRKPKDGDSTPEN